MAEDSSLSDEEAYNSLRRLIPQLAEELDGLRASLREHNVWLQRYGSAPSAPHHVFTSTSPYNPSVATAVNSSPPSVFISSDNERGEPSSISSIKSPPNYLASSTSNSLSQASTNTNLQRPLSNPRYSPDLSPTIPAELSTASAQSSRRTNASAIIASTTHRPVTVSTLGQHGIAVTTETDGPPSYGNTSPPPPPFLPPPNREEMMDRRDQTAEWLREGEDVLREYSARFAQLGTLLRRPFEDVLGSWQGSHPDNALPDYERVEEREDLMIGGVGEVPPPYVGVAVVATNNISQESDEVQFENVEDTN